jgi:hypothetical protein
MASAMLPPEHFNELYPPKKLQKQQQNNSLGFRISRSLLELTNRAASILAPPVKPQYEMVAKYVYPTREERKAPHAPRKPSPLRISSKLVQVN